MTESAKLAPPISLLRLTSVIERTGLGRSSIYERIRAGDFPKSFKIANSSSAFWSSEDIDAWVRDQISASRVSAG